VTERSIGGLLDSLGITVDVEAGEHLVEAIVIAKLAPFGGDDNTPRLIICTSAGLDWIAQLGLLRAARAVIASSLPSAPTGDDA
jgi:hypothetical protein